MAKTFDRVREQFYWPGMKKDVHDWVSSCEVCCRKKSPHQKHIHSLTTWKPTHPFWQVALDIMGPLAESSGNKYILLTGDQFTKWYEAIPRTSTTAYHPQGNPVIERTNRTIEVSLAKYVGEHHNTWSDYLPLVLMAYR